MTSLIAKLGGQVPCAAVWEACLVTTVALPQCPTRRYLWWAARTAVDDINELRFWSTREDGVWILSPVVNNVVSPVTSTLAS